MKNGWFLLGRWPLGATLATIICGACSSGEHSLGRPAGAAGGGLTLGVAGTSSGGSQQADCDPGANDADGDGYGLQDGDCNDCDGSTNPGAFDVSDNDIDEDCSGMADDEPADCDSSLPLDGDATAAARALGLCRTTTADAKGKQRTWGVISARYVFPDGSTKSLSSDILNPCTPDGAVNDESHGILTGFGPNVAPRQGSSFVALSSGVAREGVALAKSSQSQSPNGASMCTRSSPPAGFPASDFSTCGDLLSDDTPATYDGMALELVIRAPSNAKGFSFDFDFYTFEYTDWVCSGFNDGFVALLYSSYPDLPANHNVAFDAQSNPVSVNNAFVEVCEPYIWEGTKGGQPFTREFACQYGTSELEGTGFDSESGEGTHAATGWLRTRASSNPGEELTLRFAIWDTGDEMFDSTVLLDNFAWDSAPGAIVTERPVVK